MDEDEEPHVDDTHRGEIRGLWWMYPHSGDDNFINWVIGCAWIWVAMSVCIIDWIDSTYYDGYGSVPLVMSLVLFSLLLVTCGRGPCYWIHRDTPWAILIGSVLVVGMLLFGIKR